MVPTNQLKNQHLLWRAGFGPSAITFKKEAHGSQRSLLKHLIKSSEKTPAYIDVTDSAVKEIYMGMDSMMGQQRKQLSEADKMLLRNRSREGLRNINLTWLNQMVESDQQLREKMSLFWHGHFATRTVNILHQQQLLDVIRRNALGKFPDLLREVSKSAAMINFLNNNQNRKGRPNENFAREVMELFTLGRGNYTEEDIKEAARAFTGWGANAAGTFQFRKNQHDEGNKTVLGKSGALTGDDVLNILTENPQTANFITRKIYRYFVNEQVDESRIVWLSKRFYQSNYDITELMTDIFSSDWFYEPRNIGCRIKSPVELIAGIRRTLPMQITNAEVQLTLQRLLGQQLFYPPNVAGWPGGKNWIDSSSLMLRLRIPQMIYSEDELTLKPKDDDDQMMGMMENSAYARASADKPINTPAGSAAKKPNGRKGGQLITASVDWPSYIGLFAKTPREKLVTELSGSLLQAPNSISETTLNKYVDNGSRESFIKSATIQLMSTPEYQLC